MELRQLRYFAEVARAGTYAAAADRLHVAQPGVWNQVRGLERELGIALFERVGRRVRLTSAGEQLLSRTDDALTGVNRIAELAAELQAGIVGTIRVGCVSAHVAGFLGRLVAAHRHTHPGVRVQLHEITVSPSSPDPDPFLAALAAGNVDAVTTSSTAREFESFPVYDVHVVAVPGPGHRWRKQQVIHVAELHDEPLVVTPPGYLSRTLLERACDHAGVDLTIAMDSSSPNAILALGRVHIGVPVLASDAVPPTTKPLPVIVDDNGPLRQTVLLCTRRDPDRAPVLADFVEHARQLAAN